MHTEDYTKFISTTNVLNFRFLISVTLFATFIAVPMSMKYSTSKSTGTEYENIINKEYNEWLGIDIFCNSFTTYSFCYQ